MTNPYTAASPVPQNPDTQLQWEADSAKRAAARQNASQNSVIVTPAEAQLTPEQDYNQAKTSILQRGNDLTAGVQQSRALQQKQKREQEQQAYQQQLQQSVTDLGQQLKDQQTQMQKDYAKQANDYEDKLTQYHDAAQQQINQYQQQMQDYNQSWYDWLSQNGLGTSATGNYVKNTALNRNPGGYLAGSQYSGQASQIATYARQAGFPDSAIPTAVAIAMAESSGRADATHGNQNGSTDYGLMQINSVHGNLLKNYNWSDPAQNMQMAYQVWKDAGGSFSPWVTYNTGAYHQFMDVGQSAYKQSNLIKQQQQSVVSTADSALRQKIVADAKTYFGVPYVWGGESRQGVDCSGLVQQVYSDLGIELPRTANAQAHYGKAVPISQLQPGDLVAWTGGWRGPNPTAAQQQPSYVGHIAIYVGNGQIIEAYTSGTNVRQTALAPRTRNLRPDESVYGVHLSLTP